MSCKIAYKENFKKWSISIEAINKLYKFIYEDTEKSGTFKIDTVDKKTKKEITIVDGDKDSVETPLSLINYHTHPISCYVQEKCTYGWLSGEDIRECIIFALQGTIAHILCAIEGIYVCQLNPCIVENLIKLDNIDISDKMLKLIGKYNPIDFYRGLIITCIEIYFRSSHAFRTQQFNNSHTIKANDYIKYINNFKFSNIFNDVKKNGSIDGGHVWSYEHKLVKNTFEKYVENYESDTYVIVCDKHGNRKISNITVLDVIKNDGLIKDLKFTNNCKYSKDLWSENWFLTKLYYSDIYYDKKYIKYDDLSTTDKLKFIKTASKNKKKDLIKISDKPMFYFFELTGECDHNNIKDNLHFFGRKRSGKKSKLNSKSNSTSFTPTSNKVYIYGSEKCSYCKIATDKYKKLNYDVKTHYFPEIKDAIAEVKKIDDSINTIPAIFIKIN